MTINTGAPWLLRKPESTDALASIDDQVRNLADDVDDRLDFAAKSASGWRIAAANNDFTTAAYNPLPQAADAAAVQLAFTKKLGAAESNLLVHIMGSWAVQAGPMAQGRVGVRIAGVDFDVVPQGVPTTTRVSFAGVRAITGLAAGAKVILPVFKSTVGTTYRLWINDDFVSIAVREVLV